MRRALSLLAAVGLLFTPNLSAAQEKPAGMTFTPYGFVLLNTFVNDGAFNNKDNANQVVVPSVAQSGGSFLMSARGSRLGFKLANLDTGWVDARLSGVFEFDFRGGHIATNSAGWNNGIMRLRLANLKADWAAPYGNWQILAGQDYALLLNANPTSVTYIPDPAMVQSGNLYRRTPQIRATYSRPVDTFGFELAVAVLSPSDADTQGTSGVDYGVGNKSRMPDLEARVAASFKSGDMLSGTVGVGYMAGKRRYYLTDPAGPGTHKDIDKSLLGIDADLSITQFLQLKGEFYSNSGAEDGYNGVFPGVFPSNPPATTLSTASLVAVTSDGYWAQAILKPIPAVWLVAGYGEAKASKSKIANGGRYDNTQVHAGAIFNAGKNLKFSVEMAQTESKYLNATSEKAEQYSFSTQLVF
jgi:hypothetical protein